MCIVKIICKYIKRTINAKQPDQCGDVFPFSITQYKGLSFGTGNGYLVDRATKANFSPGSSDFTVLSWSKMTGINSTAGVFNTIIAKAEIQSTNNDEWILGFDPLLTGYRFFISNNGSTLSTASLSSSFTGTFINAWNASFGIRQGNLAILQVNKQTGSVNFTGSVFAGTGGLTVGGITFPNRRWLGEIDETAYWNRALSTGERDYLYNNGIGRHYYELGVAGTSGANLLNGLQAYWNFDDNNESGLKRDSVYNNNLTGNGFFTTGSGLFPNPDISNALRIDLRKAKLNSYSLDSLIGQNVLVNMSFTLDSDPDDFSKGIFMSGHLNLSKMGNYFRISHASGVASGDGAYLATDSTHGRLIINNIPLY